MAAQPQTAQGSAVPTPESALHFLPPLAPKVSLPALDATVLDKVTVEPCELTATGCRAMRVLSSSSAGAQRVTVARSHYQVTWNSAADNVVVNRTYRVVIRVGNLRLGSVDLVATNRQVSPNNGTMFNAGDDVSIKFHIAANPVVRARVLHARHYPAYYIAQRLRSEFALAPDDIVEILYGDGRNGVTGHYTLVAAVTTAGESVACSSTTVQDQPFTSADLTRALACSFGTSPAEAAGLLDTRTGFPDSDVIDGLEQTFPGWTAADSADVLKTTLDVTDPTEAASTLLDAGHSLLDAATALKEVYALSAAEFAGVAYNLVLASEDINASLETAYGLTPADADEVLAAGAADAFDCATGDPNVLAHYVDRASFAGALRACGYSATSVARLLQTTATYKDTSASLATATLLKGGYTPSQTALALRAVYALQDTQTARLLFDNSTSPGAVAVALKDAYSATLSGVAAALHTGKFTTTEIVQALAGPAFTATPGQAAIVLRQFADITPTQSAIALDTVYGLGAMDVGRVMTAAPYTPVQVAGALHKVFSLTATQFAAVARDLPYDATTTARALAATYGTDGKLDGSLVSTMRAAGFTLVEVATGLRFSDPPYSPAAAVSLLRAGGFAPEDAAADVGRTYGLDADAIAAVLHGSGWTPLEIGRVLFLAPFSLSPSATAEVFRGIHVGAADVLRVLKLVQGIDGNSAAATSLRGGYAPPHVAVALRSVYAFALSQAIDAFESAGLPPVDSMPAVRAAYPEATDAALVSAFRTGTPFPAAMVADGLLAVLTGGTTPHSSSASQYVPIMADAGYAPAAIVDAARTSRWNAVVTASIVVAGLRDAGYSAQQIAPPLVSSYGVTATSFTALAAGAGYDVVEVGRALSLSPFALTPGQVAAVLVGKFAADSRIVTVLKTIYALPVANAATVLRGDAKYPADAAVRGLREVYGVGSAEATRLVRDAGYPAVEVGDAIIAVYSLDGLDLTKVLLDAGFTPAEAARALHSGTLHATAGTVVGYLTRLAFGVDDVVIALRDGIPSLTITEVFQALRSLPTGVDKPAFVDAVARAYANLDAADLSKALTTALAVTDTQTILNLIANARDAMGVLAFTCTETLGAIDVTSVTALRALGMLHVAGCTPPDALVAIARVLQAGQLEDAKAAIRMTAFSPDSIAEGLRRAHADVNVAGLLNTAARNLVGTCTDYVPVTTGSNATTLAQVLDRGGLTLDEIVPLLKTKCAYSAATVARVVAPATGVLNEPDSTVGPALAQHFDADDVVSALATVYAAAPSRIADVLVGRYSNDALVAGLARSLRIGAGPLVAIVRANVGVANISQVGKLVAGVTTAAGERLYGVHDVLVALEASFGALDASAALSTLRFAGYSAASMIPAIVDADPARGTHTGALELAAAAVEYFPLPMEGATGVIAGLESAYGGINVSGILRTTAGNIVQERCSKELPTSNFGVAQLMSGALTRGGVPASGAVDLLARECGMSALQIGYVVSPVTGFYSIPAKYVRAASTAALSATASAGTLTATSFGKLPLGATDGVQVADGDRVLVKNQANAALNGIYTVGNVGSPTARWQLTRATDNDEGVEFSRLEPVAVAEGLDNVGTSWVVTSDVPVVGSSAITYSRFTPLGSMVGRYNQLDAGDLVTELVANGFSVRGRDGMVAALRYAYGATPGVAARALSGSFGLTATLQGIKDVYVGSDLAPVSQAVELAKAVKGVPGLVGADPADLLRALGDTLKDEPGVGGPGSTLQCVASVGAIKGADYKLLDKDAPGNGIVATLDDDDVAQLFPSPFSGGSSGNLAKFGSCLADNDIGVPFPLVKVEVKYNKVRFGATLWDVPRGILTSHVGWAPSATGGSLDGIGLPMLPALALEGNLQFRTTDNDPNCPASWDLQRDNVCQHYTIHDDKHLGTRKSTKLSLVNSANGDFDMFVPALPGKLDIDAGYYSGTVLGCGTDRTYQDEPIAASAIAAPVSVYTALPGASGDIVAHNSSAKVDISVSTPSGPTDKTIRLKGSGDRCGRTTHDDTELDYSVAVTQGTCVVSPLAATWSSTNCASQVSAVAGGADGLRGIGQGVATVTDTHNNGAYDVSRQALPGGPASGAAVLPGIDSRTGNFLALMGAAGMTPSSGLSLATLLTTGYPG